MQAYVDFLIENMGDDKHPKQRLIDLLAFGIAKIKLIETPTQSRSKHALFSPDQDWVSIANEIIVYLKESNANEDDSLILTFNKFASRIADLKPGNELFAMLKAFLSVFKQYAILLDTNNETELIQLVDSALNADSWQSTYQHFCMTCIPSYIPYYETARSSFESLRNILSKNKFNRIVQDLVNLVINAPSNNQEAITYYINLAAGKKAVILPEQYQLLIKTLLISLSDFSISMLIRLRMLMKKEEMEKFFNQLYDLLCDDKRIYIHQSVLAGIGACARLVPLSSLELVEPLIFQYYLKHGDAYNPATSAEHALIKVGEVLIPQDKFQETLATLFTQSENTQQPNCSSACYLLLKLLPSLNEHQKSVVIQQTRNWLESIKLSNKYHRLNDVLAVISEKKDHIPNDMRDMITSALIKLINHDALSINDKCNVITVINTLGCKLDERTMDSLLYGLVNYLSDFIQSDDHHHRCDEVRFVKRTLLSLLHWMTGEAKLELARLLFLLKNCLLAVPDQDEIIENITDLSKSITGDMNLTEFYQFLLNKLNNPDIGTSANRECGFVLDILYKINPRVIPPAILSNILNSLIVLITSQCIHVRRSAFYACSNFSASFTDIQRENIEDLLYVRAVENQYHFIAPLKKCMPTASWPNIVKFLLDNLGTCRNIKNGDGILKALRCYFPVCSDELKNEIIGRVFTWLVDCKKETPCFWPALSILQTSCFLAALKNHLSYEQRMTVISKLLQYIDYDHPFPYGQKPSDDQYLTFIMPALRSLIPTLTYHDRLLLLAQLATRKNPSWQEQQLFICIHAVNENEILLRYSENRIYYRCGIRDIAKSVIKFC